MSREVEYGYEIALHPLGLLLLAIWREDGFVHYKSYDPTDHYKKKIRRLISQYCGRPKTIRWDRLEKKEKIERGGVSIA